MLHNMRVCRSESAGIYIILNSMPNLSYCARFRMQSDCAYHVQYHTEGILGRITALTGSLQAYQVQAFFQRLRCSTRACSDSIAAVSVGVSSPLMPSTVSCVQEAEAKPVTGSTNGLQGQTWKAPAA